MRLGLAVFGATLAAGGALLFTAAWLGAVLDGAATLEAIWIAAFVLGLLAARTRFEVSLATSLVLPWVGLSFVLPLTIHYAFAMACDASSHVFTVWVWECARWGAPAHLTLAILTGLRCQELAAGRIPDHKSLLSKSGLLATASGVAAVPWVFPAYVGLATALPIAPLLIATDWVVRRERTRLVLPEARALA